MSRPAIASVFRVRLARVPWRVWFVALATVWGASFMFIKVADERLAPLQVALGRMLFGTALLVVVLAATNDRLPRASSTWLHLAVAAVFFNAAPFSLFAWGETHVSSIVAGIWNATTPLMTLLFAFAALPQERPTRQRCAGLVIGFVGAAVVLGPWNGLEGRSLGGNLACLAAAACYGVGFVYTRRFIAGRADSAVSLSTGQLLCGTLELAAVAVIATAPPAGVTARVAASVAALGMLGTGVAYILNYRIIRAAGATVAASVTYVIPVFATIFGILLLSEPLRWNEPLGAAVIVLGVALSEGRITLGRWGNRAKAQQEESRC